jgi:hypothetical protein
MTMTRQSPPHPSPAPEHKRAPDAAALPRRTLLASAATCIAPAGLLTLGTTACRGDAGTDRQLSFLRLDLAMAEVNRLATAPNLAAHTAWNWAQTLTHLAQSIEYAMTGYPQARSALFQRTVGAGAFGLFAWRGRMSHPLDDPIPGAPALDLDTDAASALARLQGAVQAFQAHSGPLQPHFAYGALDKAEYEQAHAMHLANHLWAFDTA